MPSGQDTESNELELEVMEDDESAEDTQDTDDGEGESEGELNLETDEKVEKLSPAEESAKVQEEAWLLKVTTGKAEITDAPKWLQGRLNSRLDATNKVPETEEVVKKVLEKEREDANFKSLQSQLPKLTATQAKELTERFNRLRPAGKVVALQAALDAMGLSQKVREAEARGIAKGRTSLPVSGQPSVKGHGKVVGGVPLDVVQDDKKWNEMIRQGQNT